MEKKFLVSSSPHIYCKDSVPKIMYTVILTLVPAGIGSVYFYGPKALWIILLSILSAVATEAVMQKIMKIPVAVSDGSAILTGILLAYNVPSSVPLWLPVVGSFFAIAVGKMVFGGLGYNPMNPALLGRAFLLASWPTHMTIFTDAIPKGGTVSGIDIMTGATPLSAIKNGLRMAANGQVNNLLGENASASLSKIHGAISTKLSDLIFGATGGSIGETCAILLILGGCYLIWKGYIRWQMPVTFIATVALLGWALPVRVGYLQDGNLHTALVWFSGNPLFHIFSGGLILGAFYMATDMVTTPLTVKGTVIFGIGAGILTTVIRLYGGYPEGVCYAILLMNTVTPLIDRWTMPRVYGQQS